MAAVEVPAGRVAELVQGDVEQADIDIAADAGLSLRQVAFPHQRLHPGARLAHRQLRHFADGLAVEADLARGRGT